MTTDSQNASMYQAAGAQEGGAALFDVDAQPSASHIVSPAEIIVSHTQPTPASEYAESLFGYCC